MKILVGEIINQYIKVSSVHLSSNDFNLEVHDKLEFNKNMFYENE